ncbi:MAG: hypothetical protein AAGA97_00350 [Pseudomonadota bacterium]
MAANLTSDPLEACHICWQQRGYVTLELVFRTAAQMGQDAALIPLIRRLSLAFNGSSESVQSYRMAARRGDPAAVLLAGYMAREGLDAVPLQHLSPDRFSDMMRLLDADPGGFLEAAGSSGAYPYPDGGLRAGFPMERVQEALANGLGRFEAFLAARRSETAILVGNGPSLRQMDFSLFRGQDVFISNYAIRHPELRAVARGVAVSNALVASQEPYIFQLNDLWKFHPFWLGQSLRDTDQTVWLNALGGKLFFSRDVRRNIAWHSTVTFFWLQVLYTAGYRKVLLVGVDNSYVQVPGAKEGDLLRQEGDDPNHFDSGYFRGKLWQAADTGRMADTYALAKEVYDADGREIVNCGIGGKLELFRRAPLAQELPPLQKSCTPPPEPPLHTDPFVRAAEAEAPAGAQSGRLLTVMTARLMQDPIGTMRVLDSDPRLRAVLARADAKDPRQRLFERARNWAGTEA